MWPPTHFPTLILRRAGPQEHPPITLSPYEALGWGMGHLVSRKICVAKVSSRNKVGLLEDATYGWTLEGPRQRCSCLVYK